MLHRIQMAPVKPYCSKACMPSLVHTAILLDIVSGDHFNQSEPIFFQS
jgi:hypothetical protein